MLSRTADNMFWLARYVERAEYLARILEATQRLTAVPTSEGMVTNEWESAVSTAGCVAGFFSAHKEANEQTVTDFLAFSPDNPSSIRSCFEVARTNARSVRTALTTDMWESINTAWSTTSSVSSNRHSSTRRFCARSSPVLTSPHCFNFRPSAARTSFAAPPAGVGPLSEVAGLPASAGVFTAAASTAIRGEDRFSGRHGGRNRAAIQTRPPIRASRSIQVAERMTCGSSRMTGQRPRGVSAAEAIITTRNPMP